MVVRRINSDELTHHGIKGQKWGVRRYQNYDGTLIGTKKHTTKTAKQYAREHNLELFGPGAKYDKEMIGEHGQKGTNSAYKYVKKYTYQDGSLTKKGAKQMKKSIQCAS